MNNIGLYTGGKSISPDIFQGSVAITGTGAANCTVFKGSLKRVITSVVYAATGIYTITFATGFTFPEVPNFLCSIVSTVPSDIMAVVSQEFLNSNRTLVVQTFTANTGAPVALPTTAKLVLFCEGKLNSGV